MRSARPKGLKNRRSHERSHPTASRSPAAAPLGRAEIIHPYAWLWEPLEAEPTFVLRAMFGTKAAYVGGRLVLCFSARKEPWRGVLVCTDREHHASLVAEFPALLPHPILPKWLYLPDESVGFEATAERLVRQVRQRDPRIGIEPKPEVARQKRRPARP